MRTEKLREGGKVAKQPVRVRRAGRVESCSESKVMPVHTCLPTQIPEVPAANIFSFGFPRTLLRAIF